MVDTCFFLMSWPAPRSSTSSPRHFLASAPSLEHLHSQLRKTTSNHSSTQSRDHGCYHDASPRQLDFCSTSKFLPPATHSSALGSFCPILSNTFSASNRPRSSHVPLLLPGTCALDCRFKSCHCHESIAIHANANHADAQNI